MTREKIPSLELNIGMIMETKGIGLFDKIYNDETKLLSKSILLFMFNHFIESGETVFSYNQYGHDVSKIVESLNMGLVSEEDLNSQFEILYESYSSRFQMKH